MWVEEHPVGVVRSALQSFWHCIRSFKCARATPLEDSVSLEWVPWWYKLVYVRTESQRSEDRKNKTEGGHHQATKSPMALCCKPVWLYLTSLPLSLPNLPFNIFSVLTDPKPPYSGKVYHFQSMSSWTRVQRIMKHCSFWVVIWRLIGTHGKFSSKDDTSCSGSVSAAVHRDEFYLCRHWNPILYLGAFTTLKSSAALEWFLKPLSHLRKCSYSLL